jgi:two-component system, NarL family, nitrate/nitrite response regulator NarL
MSVGRPEVPADELLVRQSGDSAAGVCEAGAVTTEKVRVVVGDDHPLFRDGVVRALASSGEIDVVAEADDGSSALELIKAHKPDVALLDYRMPGMDGAQVAAAVRRDELPTRVLLVSAHDESAIVYSALQEGAAGFLPKESTRSELVNAVLACAKGRDVVAPSLAAGLAGEIRRRGEPQGPTLSAREREVLKLIADGHTIPAMAKELYLAPSTVKTHVQRLYEKLGVGDRAAAVAEAMRRKLLD